MQENNQKEGTEKTSDAVVVPTAPEPVETLSDSNSAEVTVDTVSAASEVPVVVATTAKSSSFIKRYGFAFLAILVIGIALVFVLEREGRISTGLFSYYERNQAVARVNDVKIIKGDYDSSLKQLMDMATKSGANTEDAAVVEQIKKQTIDTLVNGELLRQAAQKEGVTVDKEAVDARYEKIETEVGGADVLATRMAEFDITVESLRRDIENEILIDGLVKKTIDPNPVAISDEEISAFYDQAVQSLDSTVKAPPLSEVREGIAAQIQKNRLDEKIAKFLEDERAGAKIEILI